MVRRLIGHAASLIAAGVPTVLAGDYNVVPTPNDVYSERSLNGNALIQPESREAFARLLSQGWMDALRHLQPEVPPWTFWSYLPDRRAANKGMRLDHLLVSPDLADRMTGGGVDDWTRDEDGASDHTPAWVTLQS